MLSEILTFIAGIGVFLFSIKLLSKSIEDLCGNKIRRGFNKLSNNRFKNFGLGFGITLLLQSSTASIMMTSGFVSAGLISIVQAFGIVLGSNLASGITPYLLTFSNFKITGFFCALAGVGAFLLILSKKPLIKKIANVIVAFSLVFVGLQLISSATEIFKQNSTFLNFFTSTTNPILLLLIGFAFTLLIQSSLGTMAVIVALVPGIIPLKSAIFIVYGANLGSALTTSFFAYISSNQDGKKMAIFHTLINLVGTIVFSVISLFDWVSVLSWIQVPVLILVTVNLIFNLFNTALFTALLKPSLWLIKKMTGNRRHRAKNKYEIEYKDNEPSAVTIAKVSDKCILCFDNLKTLMNKTLEYIETKEDIKAPIKKLDYLIDNVKKLQLFTLKIPTSGGETEENNYLEKLFVILKMVERNAINCKKIITTLLDEEDRKITFSIKILKYVQKLSIKINELFDIIKVFIQQPDCDFDFEHKPDFNKIIEINQEISQIKLNAKTYVMKNGFNSQLSIAKNTKYLSLLNYLTLISNNAIDMAFTFETDWQEKHKNEDYEQIDISSLINKIDSEAV